MTNAEIILNAQRQLAKAGKLIVDEANGIEEIHTYNMWKKLGYQVLRGEKAICMLRIWKPIPNKGGAGRPAPEKDEDEEKQKDNPWMMLKNAYFFSRSQVDSLV